MKDFQIENLKIERFHFNVEVPDLSIAQGKIHVLKGPSGCGKSTLLQGIAGFLPLVSGKISVGDKEIQSLYPEERKVAYVFQQSALFPTMTVLENVAFGLRVRGVSKAEREQKALEWLEKVSLAPLATRKAEEISGGEGQRVQLARALICDFPVLLLDEPFSALDIALKEGLRGLLKNLVKETQVSCLLVSHDPEDVKSLADSFSLMEKGKIQNA